MPLIGSVRCVEYRPWPCPPERAWSCLIPEAKQGRAWLVLDGRSVKLGFCCSILSETLCLCLSVSPHHHKSAIEQKPLILFHFRVNQGPERSLSQASLGGLLMSLFSPFPVPKTPVTILDDDVPRECQFVRVLQIAVALGDLFESVVDLPRDRKWLLHTWWPASSVVTSNPPPRFHPAEGFSSGPSLALLTFVPSP